MNGLPEFANHANLVTNSTEEDLAVTPDATPLEFLEQVYRSSAQRMARRMKAAIEAMEYVHPRLAVTAQINGDGFAEALEKAIKRSRGELVIEAEPAQQRPLSEVKGPMAKLTRY
jgi:hypothetical protein